jgi:acyl-CoA synthetase (AMP-forming)/AMP-acid ligase II
MSSGPDPYRGDLTWGTIAGLVRFAADRFGDAEALVDPMSGLRLSFSGLAAEVERAATAAIASGVTPGDRAGIWAPNSAEWVIAALGLSSAGAVLVPINTRFKGQEAAYLLEKTRATTLVTVGEFLGVDYVDALRTSGVDLPHLTTTIVIGTSTATGVTSWRHFLARAAPATLPSGSADDLSDIIFTSGTTGKPKGVMATHGQTLRTFSTWSELVGLVEGDRYLVVNPFFHTFGYKAGMLACLMRGATIVPEPVFDVDAVLRRIGEERITAIPGPPTLYQSILDHPERDKHDLSTLRLAVTGAAVVPVVLVERMRDELSFETVLTAYGLTEATGTATVCRRDDDAVTIATTSGRAIPDTEVRVVDDAGGSVSVGEPGEVVVRGYNVMRGYFEEPEETAQAIDADGWLHTGDVGVMDERGNITITDRIKDMYVVGGFNAYPAEVEQVIMRYPSVAEVAVVGVPDSRLGEVGRAYVVPKPGFDIDGDELVAWCREQMANYKAPRSVAVVDSLPRNASGKVLKFELRRGTG